MQPVNEALLTDEEFLDLVEKKLEAPIREQGDITLRAESVQRILNIAIKAEKKYEAFLREKGQEVSDKPKLGNMIVDMRSDKRLFCTERPVPRNEGYRELRMQYERKADLVYRVTLSVVNRPCGKEPGKTLFEADKAFLTEQMDRFVGNVIGELSHQRVRIDTQHMSGVEEHLNRFQCIKPEFACATLIEYELSSVRDGSGSIAIIGTVGVTPEAAGMIENGHIFALRSLIEPKTVGANGSKLNKILAFDLLLADELDPTI